MLAEREKGRKAGEALIGEAVESGMRQRDRRTMGSNTTSHCARGIEYGENIERR